MTPVPERVTVNGRTLECQLCGGAEFEHRELKLPTTTVTPLLSKSAVSAVCLGCGYVHMFIRGNLTWTRLDRPPEADS
jgi:predicted nucleic-acid-binding Zn-ribbon protein